MNSIEMMQSAFYSRTVQRYEILAPNIFLNWDNESDLAGVRKSGYLDEIEIKTSKSDFSVDFKKLSRVKSDYICCPSDYYAYEGFYYINKHKAMSEGKLLCNYFSFLLPEYLVADCDIPEYAGLYVAYKDRKDILRIKEVKKAKRLHKRKINEKLKYDIGRKMAIKYWYK